jgi:hypothetical protein
MMLMGVDHARFVRCALVAVTFDVESWRQMRNICFLLQVRFSFGTGRWLMKGKCERQKGESKGDCTPGSPIACQGYRQRSLADT